MNPTPATIAGEIMNRLNAEAHARRVPDAITVARLRRDAEKLRAVDAPRGWMAMAAIASAVFDSEETYRAAQNAVRLAPMEVDVTNNCALSLTRVGMYAEAFDFVAKLASRARGDKIVWSRFVDLSFALGHFAKFREGVAQLEKLTGETMSAPPMVTFVERFLVDHGKSESDLTNVLLAVYKFLSEQKLVDKGVNFYHLPAVDGDGERIALAFNLDLDSVEIVRVENLLFDKLDELSLPLECEDFVSVRLNSMSVKGTHANSVETTA